MGKAREISPCKRSNILLLRHTEHNSLSEISKKLNISKSAVSRILKLHNDTGSTKPSPRTGRPTKTSPYVRRRMSRFVKNNPFVSSTTLRKEIPELANVSNSNICHILNKKLKLPASKPLTKPKLTPSQLQKRLDFCNHVKNWTHEEWKRVMWSDESTIKLFRDNRHFVRRPAGSNACDPKYTKKSIKHPPSVMVWGCMSAAGRGGLFFLPSGVTMNGVIYLQVLKDHLTNFMAIHQTNIFMQDGAPCHTTKKVKEWIRDNGMELLQWPPQSPDLNPIENLWEKLKDEVSHMQCTNIPDLIDEIKRVWCQDMTREYCENLVLSMPRRVMAVLKNKGFPSKY